MDASLEVGRGKQLDAPLCEAVSGTQLEASAEAKPQGSKRESFQRCEGPSLQTVSKSSPRN